MDATEALGIWLGPLDDGPDGAARCLFAGAGLTKATNGAAPVFWNYHETLAQRIEANPQFAGLSASAQAQIKKRDYNDPSELIELLDRLGSRTDVAEIIFAEPMPPAVNAQKHLPWNNPVPASDDAVYRPFEEWKNVLLRHGPMHAAVLEPDGPPVVLGRLMAEGAFDLFLSTNWDPYIELGAWLVGLDVCIVEPGMNNHRNDTGERIRLDVFDRPSAAALTPRFGHHPTLLKLHGGIDHIRDIFKSVPGAERNERLCESFLVSTSDLTHWREASQWVQDAVSDALRAHRTLFVGVSGADPVTFRVTRERVREWEKNADREGRRVRSGHVYDEPLPLVAVDYGPKVRLESMLTAQRTGRGTSKQIKHHVVQGDAKKFIRAAYAWFMVQRMAHVLAATGDAVHRDVRDRLVLRMQMESGRAVSGGKTPLIDVLCDSIGPSARWAGMSENRPTFALRRGAAGDRRAHTAVGRWRYAPWFRDGSVDEENVRIAAACAVALSRDDAVHVDPWSGIVQLPGSYRGVLQNKAVFPIIWPWPVRVGFGPETERQLHRRFDWGRGRPALKHVSPQLRAVLLPDSVAEELERRGQHEVRISSARVRLDRSIDWWTEALR